MSEAIQTEQLFRSRFQKLDFLRNNSWEAGNDGLSGVPIENYRGHRISAGFGDRELITNRLSRRSVERRMRTGQPNCTRLRLVAGAWCFNASKRSDERHDQRDY
jgi:hypothetical protein